jgi:hypothetical protein
MMEDEMMNIEQIRERLGKRHDDDVGALLGGESRDDQAEMVLAFLEKARWNASGPEDREESKEDAALLKEEVEHMAGLLSVPVGRIAKMVREAQEEARVASTEPKPVRTRKARAKKSDAVSAAEPARTEPS